MLHCLPSALALQCGLSDVSTHLKAYNNNNNMKLQTMQRIKITGLSKLSRKILGHLQFLTWIKNTSIEIFVEFSFYETIFAV